MFTIKIFITTENLMNFIAVYIGHRCTLWFYKFTLNKYFGSSESFSKSLVMKRFTPCSCSTLSFRLWMPVSEGTSVPAHTSFPERAALTWCQASGGVRALLGLSGLVSVSGSLMYPGLRLGAFLALLPCSPRQPNSACFCGKLGQETVLPLWLVAVLCFHW